ncbi:MAG: class I SAM-dependent methyltransferase, partial [Acidobacteriota bacterium]|nr:class I SAM-dependent methyltransferase [Acidobacteriota bacterium]
MSRVDRFFKTSPAEYESYMRAEWQSFIADSSRAKVALESVDGMIVERALDVGCGGGQELIPFLALPSAFGVGVDVVEGSGRVGRELFSARVEGERVTFVTSAAEALPFQSGSFDVAICRLALPYT